MIDALDPNADWEIEITTQASRLGFMKEVV